MLKDFTAVVTYTNGAETRHVFSKSGTSITMAGYDQQPGSGTLVFSYTYAYPSSGLTSTGTAELAYTMQEPRPTELTLADDVAVGDDERFHVALGAQVGGLYSQLRFTVKYDDGLTSETVVPGELLSITDLSTDRYGEGVAKVTYKGDFAGEDRTIELKYFVDASPQSYFDFVFVDKNGTIVRNGEDPYYATDTDAFVLPEGYENYTVAVYWLREDTSAKRLAIPETIVAGGQTFAVTHIVNGAFSAAAGGNNITYIYIPSSVVSIGERSFVDANSLRELDLRHASGLKFIGKEAFKGTTSLSSVDFTVATGLAAIGESAFQGSERLTNVTLGGVKKIEGRAFNGAKALVNIDLSRVTDIGAYAFEDCAALSGINLTSLRRLGDNAFEGCTALSEIVTPDTSDLYGGNGGVLVAYGEVVAVSDTATDIVIPAGVTAIASYAFEGKDQVVTLSVAADFTLNLVDLAERFPLLKSITVESGNPNYLSDAGALYNAAGTELLFIPVKYPGALVVREGVTALDSALFEGRTGINALTVPASVTTVSEGVLSPLTALVSLTVPTVGATGEFCTWFGKDAAAVPGTLTSVTVTGAVEAVDFAQFGADIEVTLNGLTYKNGVLVSVPEGTGAVVVISGAKGIAADAFEAPAGVKSVDIPASVTNIADGAFSGMTVLTAITVAAGNGAYSSVDDALYNKAGTTLLLVPATKLSAPVIIADSVTRIAAGALGSDPVTVYSESTRWGSVTAEDATTVTVAYYSADDPYAAGAAPEGVYWHEDGGVPVLWEKQPEVTE